VGKKLIPYSVNGIGYCKVKSLTHFNRMGNGTRPKIPLCNKPKEIGNEWRPFEKHARARTHTHTHTHTQITLKPVLNLCMLLKSDMNGDHLRSIQKFRTGFSVICGGSGKESNPRRSI
jgi:hypothetical protein